ncbi:MAG: hypothetical protein ACE3NC_03455 [Candidatus Wallacebacter cryptica]
MAKAGAQARFLIIVIVVSFLSGCFGGGGSSSSNTFNLTVTVLDDAAKQPVVGAVVEVVGKGLAVQETNANGKVTFLKLAGSIELLIKAPGFSEQTQTVLMSKDQNVTVYLTAKVNGVVVETNENLAAAVADPTVTKITVVEDLVLYQKLVIDRPVRLDLHDKTLTGDVEYVFDESGSLQLTGTGQIDGNLIVNAPHASISNNLRVTGVISILAVASQTWNDYQSGNEYVVSCKHARIKLYQGAAAIHFTESGGDNVLFIDGTVESFIADSSVEVEGAKHIVHATVNAQGIVFDYPPAKIDGSETPEIINSDPVDPQPQEIAGPRFATVSKRDGAYFDFEKGETSAAPGEADLKLTWVQIGNKYTLIGFENCAGMQFGVNPNLGGGDLNLILQQFRTVTAADWRPSETLEAIQLAPYDTLILKTNTGRLVKVFILEIRGHWQHDDAAAVDFIYLFLDEVDETPPEIESVTLVTESSARITRPIQAGVIEFEIDEDPERIYFSFSEVVYSNRPLARGDINSGFPPSQLWFSANAGYLGSPYLAREFGAGISVYGMSPSWSVIELSGGDEAFYEDLPNDHGFFFADIFGNELTELPFDKIVIKRVEP